MKDENIVYIPSGSVLTKEQSEMLYKLSEQPIKIVYEGAEVTSDEDKFKMTIKLLSKIGEHNMAALDCSDMSEEEITEIDKIIDEFNKIGCTSFQFTADELKEILERQENE